MDLSVPNNFLSNVGSTSTEMIGNLGGVSALIIGIFLAFLVLEIVLRALGVDKDKPDGV